MMTSSSVVTTLCMHLTCESDLSYPSHEFTTAAFKYPHFESASQASSLQYCSIQFNPAQVVTVTAAPPPGGAARATVTCDKDGADGAAERQWAINVVKTSADATTGGGQISVHLSQPAGPPVTCDKGPLPVWRGALLLGLVGSEP